MAWKSAGFNIDDAFEKACQVTGEWAYKKKNGPIVERITPIRMSEQTIPLKHRNMVEILDPQPQASTVIHNLLDWIDRVDIASQYRLPRPAFATREGYDIFPPDEVWWLTDVQKRRSSDDSKQGGDEDGPPSDADAEENISVDDDAAITDDDPMTEEENEKVHPDPELAWRLVSKGPILPIAHEKSSSDDYSERPSSNNECTKIHLIVNDTVQDKQSSIDSQVNGVARALSTYRKRFIANPVTMSRKTPRLEYRAYFEIQSDEARCGMHALNNALGVALHTPESMSHAIDVYLETMRWEGSPEKRSMHEKRDGWYSSEILSQALTTCSLWHSGRVEYVFKLNPLFNNPNKIKVSVGAVANINNAHWVALRWMHDRVWLLDSQEKRPIPLSWQVYMFFIDEHKDVYPIEAAQEMAEGAGKSDEIVF